MTGDDDDSIGLASDRHTLALERLSQKIDNRDLLYKIHVDVVAHRGETRSSAATLSELAKTVYGNGTPGLKTHVDRLVQDFNDRRWRDRLVIGAVITTLMVELFSIFKPLISGGH